MTVSPLGLRSRVLWDREAVEDNDRIRRPAGPKRHLSKRLLPASENMMGGDKVNVQAG